MWALLAVTLLAAPAVDGVRIHSVYPAGCKDGLVKAERGPFAAWLFCEDALASHLGVMYADHMAAPVDGAWGISDRFWQERPWASDVQTFAWSADGEQLFVSTGAIYGTSSLYRLDLGQRQAVRLSGPHADQSVELTAVRAGQLRFRLRNVQTDAIVERTAKLQKR